MMARPKAVLVAIAVALMLQGCAGNEIVLTGKRLDLRTDLDAPAEVTGNQARPIALAAPRAIGEWSHVASGPDHDIPHATLSAVPRLALSVPIGAGEDRRRSITADPVVSGGRIFTVDSRAQLAAHDLGGRALWTRSLVPSARDAGDAAGGGLAVSGGRVFATTGFGTVTAVDAATGRVLWTQDVDAGIAGAPTVAGDRVYVVARDATAWSIDAGSGRVQWTLNGTRSDAGIVGGAAPAVAGNLAVLPFASRELVGVLPDGGTRLWTSNVAGTRLGRAYAAIGDISGDPVISGGRVFAGSPSGRTNAFDLRSGEQLWSAADGAMSAPLVAGGSVFVVSDQAELVRLDAANGEAVWKTPLPYYRAGRIGRRRGVTAHFGPVLAGGRLWVASSDGLLRGFDPASGVQRAAVNLPGGAATNPALANGALYVVSREGRLLAFR